MKKQVLAALAVFFMLVAPAFAGNTSTDLGDLPIRIGGVGPVKSYLVAIDTTAQDLTVYDATGSDMVCVVGMVGADATAANITWKSGSTTLVVPEIAANYREIHRIGEPLFCTMPGQDLVMQSSGAISSLLLQLLVSSNLVFK